MFWASKLYAESDPNHTGSTYNRMLYATTRDFRTFSAPKVWQDTGVLAHRLTVIKVGDTYHRFTKDEAQRDRMPRHHRGALHRPSRRDHDDLAHRHLGAEGHVHRQ